MVPPRFLRQAVLLLCLSVVTFAVCVQISAGVEYHPDIGQDGKDVVWVPTCQALVDKMLDMAEVTPKDYLIDLGSGDGRTVITAAKRGARSLGIEYNSDLVDLSKQNAAAEGVGEKALFVQGDIFETDFSNATVLTMFLLTELNVRLRPLILEMKPNTRVVSNTFDMGEWPPDDEVEVDAKDGCISYFTAFLWIVPAKVEGTWSLPQGELTLKQTFQTFSGTLESDGKTVSITDGRLKGDRITFSVEGTNYSGRVNGSKMEGTFQSNGSTGKWNAAQAFPGRV